MSRMATFVAATTEAIHQTWHDYVRYLEAQQVLLAAPDAPDAAFERDDAGDDAEAQARATLAAIPTARRAAFDTVLEQERQRALVAAEAAQRAGGGRGPLDPASVEHTVLQRLHDEALGIGTPTPGRGLVPLAPEADDWYEVDVAALQDAPAAGAYLLQAADADERRAGFRRAGLIAALGALALGGWGLWTWGMRGPTTSGAVAPMVGSVDVTPWPLRSLTLTTMTTTLTMPIRTTTATTWPTTDGADTPPVAFWRAPTLLPLTLCLPPALLDRATTITLHSDPTQPARRYTVQPTLPTGHPDLVITSCGGAQATPQAGILTDIPLPADQPLGTAVAVGDTALTVESITEIGPGDDPTLPADTNRVVVVVQTRTPLAWPTLAPTLLLADGRALTDGARAATSAGLILRYLVPRRAEPRSVVWQLTPPDGQAALRWRATLPVPPSRLAVLRDRLQVAQVTITAQTARSRTVALTLRNTSSEPLLLTAADLTLTADAHPLPLPALAALATPLAPAEGRLLTLILLRPSGATGSVLSIGPYRFALPP